MHLYYLNSIINNFTSNTFKNKCDNMVGKLLFFRFEKNWHYFSHFGEIWFALTWGDIFSQHWKFWERFVISAWPIHSSNTWHSSFFHQAIRHTESTMDCYYCSLTHSLLVEEWTHIKRESLHCSLSHSLMVEEWTHITRKSLCTMLIEHLWAKVNNTVGIH